MSCPHCATCAGRFVHPTSERPTVLASPQDTINEAHATARPGLMESSADCGGCGGRMLVTPADEPTGQHRWASLGIKNTGYTLTNCQR